MKAEKEALMKDEKKKSIKWERMTSEEMINVQGGVRYQVGGEPGGPDCPCLVEVPRWNLRNCT